jgi:hypothetical protein
VNECRSCLSLDLKNECSLVFQHPSNGVVDVVVEV